MTLLLIGFATRFLFACMLCYLTSFCHYSCLLPCLFFLACQCLISGFLISHQSPEMPSCKTFPTHLHFTFLSGFKYISLYSLILILTITGLPERGGGLNIQTGKLSEQGFYQRSVIENLKRAKKNVFFFSLFELLARIIEYHIQYAFLRLKTETNTGIPLYRYCFFL